MCHRVLQRHQQKHLCIKFEYLAERAVYVASIILNWATQQPLPYSLPGLAAFLGQGLDFLQTILITKWANLNPSRQGHTGEETWESTSLNFHKDMEYFSIRDNLSTIIAGWQATQLRHCMYARYWLVSFLFQEICCGRCTYVITDI